MQSALPHGRHCSPFRPASWRLRRGPAAVSRGQAVANEAQVSANGESQRIKLGLNKSVVIDLPADAYDILVANPAVADAVTRTARRIYLFGKSVGETNIFVFGPNGEQVVSLDLAIERDVAGLEDYLKRFIPNSDITVELLNDNVVLTGTVETPLDAKRASDLATIFVSGGEATTGQYSQTAAGGRRRRRCRHRQPRSGAPGQPDRQPAADHRRRPGHAEGHGRRSQPQRDEAARRQHDRLWRLQRHQLGCGQRQLPGLGKPLSASQLSLGHIDAQRLSQRDGAVGRHEDAWPSRR